MGKHLNGWRWGAWILSAASLLTGLGIAGADDKAPNYPKPPSAENVKVIPDGWKIAPASPATATEIDQLLTKAIKADKLRTAPLTTDEQFIRRVTLDLTGKLPLPADVMEFVASKDAKKRSKLIDQLLASDDFARHWARYWHNVVVSRATDVRIKRGNLTQALEDWLYEEFRNNRNWAEIARSMITASGILQYGAEDNGPNGAAVFLLCHSGNEAAVERAAETSRVFMGIQIQCAQCHDHPNDLWKQNQFHELTAYYARLRDRVVQEAGRQRGIQLVSLPRGEHMMPGKDDPRRGTTMQPKFLLGQDTRPNLGDLERRQELADLITSKDNYWFSAAFANRIWGELMGQAFYQPVDNMGPLQQATYPDVLLRLASSFQASDYDIRGLFRVICNTQSYQRQMRLGDSPDEHLHFAATYPTRLSASALWDSLVGVLGQMQSQRPGFTPPPGGAGARFAGRFTLERIFKDTFEFDPSTKSDEVEGSIPQALMLMNNPTINGQMKATGTTVLAKILSSYPEDEEAIKMVYLRTLARKPTNRELDTCKQYIAKVGDRAEAYEDLLWSLINSTEFQTKR